MATFASPRKAIKLGTTVVRRELLHKGWLVLCQEKNRGILPLELDPSITALFARFVLLSISPKKHLLEFRKSILKLLPRMPARKPMQLW